jgi:hypothetical protein
LTQTKSERREHLLVVGRPDAIGGVRQVVLVLDEHELLRRGERLAGRDDDRAEHPRADVHEHRRGPAVIHECAGELRPEGERDGLALGHRAEGDPRVDLRGVEVHRVRDLDVVGEGELDRVPDAAMHDRSGDVAFERPTRDDDVVGDAHRHLARAPVELEGSSALDRRQHGIDPVVCDARRALPGASRRRRAGPTFVLEHGRIEPAIGVVRLARSGDGGAAHIASGRTLRAYDGAPRELDPVAA